MQLKQLLPLLCATAGSVMAGEIDYEGSSTVGKFIRDAAQVYQAATFNINTLSESLGGEHCVVRQLCALGGVAREINPMFLEQGLKATLIGQDAIAVIVNAENPIQQLTTAQLKHIFSGQIQNWTQIGGADAPMKVFVVKAASATHIVFREQILDGEEYQGVKVIIPDAKMVNQVAQDKGAIGQISFAFLKDQPAVKAIAIDGQAATVNNPDYPISRPLYLTTLGAPKGDVKAFIDWTLSPKGQEIVKQRFVAAQ